MTYSQWLDLAEQSERAYFAGERVYRTYAVVQANEAIKLATTELERRAGYRVIDSVQENI